MTALTIPAETCDVDVVPCPVCGADMAAEAMYCSTACARMDAFTAPGRVYVYAEHGVRGLQRWAAELEHEGRRQLAPWALDSYGITCQ